MRLDRYPDAEAWAAHIFGRLGSGGTISGGSSPRQPLAGQARECGYSRDRGGGLAEKMKQWRPTRLQGALESVRDAGMLATGSDQAAVLREAPEGEFRPGQYPARIASRGENCDWFLDAPAAARLSAKA